MEQKKTKRQVIKKLAALLIGTVMVFGACTLLFFNVNQTENSLQNSNNLSLSMHNSPNVILTAHAEEATQAEEATTVNKMISAKVLPESAPDKSVSWAIEWKVNPFGDDVPVSDYVEITPINNTLYTNMLAVTAKKGFPGAEMTITCTTNVGGYVATCTVKYDGAPEKLNLFAGKTVLGDLYMYNDTFVSIPPHKSSTYDVTLDNTLHCVGENYGKNYTLEVVGSGTFYAIKQQYSAGAVTSEETVTLNFNDVLDAFFTVTLENGKLTVQTKNCVGAFSKFVDNDGKTQYGLTSQDLATATGTYYYFSQYSPFLTSKFYEHSESGCGVSVTITEQKSGIQSVFNFCLSEITSSVELDMGELIF